MPSRKPTSPPTIRKVEGAKLDHLEGGLRGGLRWHLTFQGVKPDV